MFEPILIITLASIIPAFANITNQPKCGQKVCFLLFKPVCGRNGDGEEKTFSNSCFLLIDCSDPPYKFSHDGPCKKDCNIQVCEKLYKPICAEKPNGEQLTFSNLCDFENRNCYEFQNAYKFLKDGKCCRAKCAEIYEPICAENVKGVRRTFTSQCELYENSDFKYIQDGPCCAARCSIVNKKEVCAINSKGETKIFPSECEVGAWNCSQGTDYEITSDKKCRKCKIACSFSNKPVCAINSKGRTKTFPSECKLKAFNCENGTDFKMFAPRPTTTPRTTTTPPLD